MTERLHFDFSVSCIGERNGNPLQCSCLENPREGGAWWAASMGSHRVGHDWSDLAAAAAGEAEVKDWQSLFESLFTVRYTMSCNQKGFVNALARSPRSPSFSCVFAPKAHICSFSSEACYQTTCCCSVAQSCPTLQPHGLQHAMLLCSPLSPRVCSNSCPSSR